MEERKITENQKRENEKETTDKTKSYFLKKIRQINFQSTDQGEKKTKFANTINEWVVISTDSIDIKRITQKYYEQPYANELNNSDEIDTFREINNVHSIRNRSREYSYIFWRNWIYSLQTIP